MSALLAALDDVMAVGEVFVVGVSNRPELIDPAVLRSGRLGVHLEVPDPDGRRRAALVSMLAADGGLGLDPDLAAELAEATRGWSAADLVIDGRAKPPPEPAGEPVPELRRPGLGPPGPARLPARP